MKVFLGGTCAGSNWREYVKERLKIDYFDPIVDDWNEEARQREIEERNTCDYLLYVLTPLMAGVYAVAEVAHDSAKRPHKTLLCVLEEDERQTWDKGMDRSINAVQRLVKENGAQVFDSLDDVIDFLNKFYVEIEPDPFMVECLIERDGPTTVSLDNNTYVFKKNELGDYVCRVENKMHRKYLTRLRDFRIYMEDKLPKPEFTEDEFDFMNEWKIMNAQGFSAYVNTNIDRFMAASPKIREIAQAKWQRLMPGTISPIDMALEQQRRKAATKPPVEDGETTASREPSAVTTPRDQIKALPKEWQDFYYLFSRLSGPMFREFINSKEHEAKLLESPDVIYRAAQAKWERLVKPAFDEPWPYVEEVVEDDEDESEEAA